MQAEKSELQKIIQTIWSSTKQSDRRGNLSENCPESAEKGLAGGAVYRETGIS